MKSFVPFLICAASLVTTGAAWALPEQTVFSVVIPDGPDPNNGTAVGTMYFELDADLNDGCRYYTVWEDSSARTIEANCWVNESKTLGHLNCSANSQATFTAMIQRDAKSSCSGFDTFGQPQDLFLLVGLEIPSLTGIIGLIQFSAAAPFVYTFEAQPYP